MSAETSETLIRQALDAAGASGSVHFAFQGGEPTMAGLAYFRHFLDVAAQYN